MKTKLRILLLEDDVADAALIAQELEAAGFSFQLTRIQTEAELRQELERATPDLILSDHGLPAFNGFKALDIARAVCPELPFIFVSGSNDQGMVAEMYEQGATDYVFKRDVGDLKSAVLRALEREAGVQPLPSEPGTIPAQPELKLQIPIASPLQPVLTPAIGHLLFCPQCRQARDERNQIVPLENYFGRIAEVVVLRQLCEECDHPRRSS
jgi:CheY-like chemotaxis protein